MHRLALVLAGVFAGLLVAVSPASAHGPAASFSYEPSAPAPGELVSFRATAVPVHAGEPIRLSWDLDGDSAFDDATGATVRRSFDAGEHVVRLLATTGPGTRRSSRRRSPWPRPNPSPRPSRRPFRPLRLPSRRPAPTRRRKPPSITTARRPARSSCAPACSREHAPHTIDASPSHDADGSIVRYEWDLDGNGSYERDTGTASTVTHTFEAYSGIVDPRKRIVRLRVTDDDGATAEAQLTLTLLDPACEAGVTHGRIRHVAVPAPPGHEGRRQGRRPLVRRAPGDAQRAQARPGAGKLIVIDLPRGANAALPHISSLGATVYGDDPGGGTVRLAAGGSRGGWPAARPSRASSEPKAKLNGLRITGMPSPPAARDRRLLARRLLRRPAGAVRRRDLGRADHAASRQGGRVGLRAAGVRWPTRRSDRSFKRLHVFYDGEDLWEIEASIGLPEPVALGIDGDAGIRDGEFEHAGAELEFLAGVGPFGPVMLQSIRFRVEVEPEQSECVPKVGVEYVDQRKILHDITGNWYDVPNFEIDHGVPTFAVCGGVKLTAGPKVLGASAISLDAGLGFASYADRPSVFRAFGNVSLVEIPVANALRGARERLHADEREVRLQHPRPGLDPRDAPVRDAGAEVQRDRLRRRLPGLRRLVPGARGSTSKGLAVCLKIDVLFDDWTRGFGYLWGDTSRRCTSRAATSASTRSRSSPLVDHVTAVPARAHAPRRRRRRRSSCPRDSPARRSSPRATARRRGSGARRAERRARQHPGRAPAGRAQAVPAAQGPAGEPDADRRRQARRRPLEGDRGAGVRAGRLAEVRTGPRAPASGPTSRAPGSGACSPTAWRR